MNDYHVHSKNGLVKSGHILEGGSFNPKEKSILRECFSKQINNSKIMDNGIKKDGKGRKTFVFWTLICLLLFLALGNLILTFTILGVLRIGYGMNSLELIPEASSIKFYGDTDLGHLYKVDGKINGFMDHPVEITAEDNGSLNFNLVGKSGRPINKLTMNKNGTVFRNTASFLIRGTNDNRHTFSSRSPHFNLLNSVRNLNVKLVRSNRLLSLTNSNLELKSDTSVNLRGTEGTRMESQQVIWSADQDIYLKSVNGSIIFNSKGGIVIDLKSKPTAHYSKGNSVVTQYKLCVCLPQGKLFKLPVLQGQSKTSCNHFQMTPNYNPCM